MGSEKVINNNTHKIRKSLLEKKALQYQDISSEWYKTILQSAMEGFFIDDLYGNILDVNDAFCNMTGYSREELLSMNIRDIDVELRKGDLDKFIRDHAELKRIGGTLSEVRHRRKDGKIINVALSCKYLDVGPGLFFCFHRDITEQKKTLQKLTESENRYRSLVELGTKIGEAIVMIQDIKKKEGVQTYISDRWPKICGYSKKELLGRSFFNLVSPSHRTQSLERHRKKMSGKPIPALFEIDIIHKDGGLKTIEITSAITIYKGKKANVIYIRDVTDRKKLEQEIVNAKARVEALRESEKMKTQLLSMVSHELRTPLTAIKGFANTILQDDVRWEKAEIIDFIREIESNADHLDLLVRDLLEVQSIASGKFKVSKSNYSILETVNEVENVLRGIARQHLLKIEVQENLPTVNIDKKRIIQVLNNLVENASKFSPTGSLITISAKQYDNNVVLTVTDEGKGVPHEAQQGIFNRFYRGEEVLAGVNNGFGLGLYISKQIIEAHGGKIWVKSKEGEGSQFSFSLLAEKN